MAKTEVYKCDQCGSLKGDVNRWWALIAVDYADGFHLFPWSDVTADELEHKATRHLCGQACVIQELNAFMQGAGK